MMGLLGHGYDGQTEAKWIEGFEKLKRLIPGEKYQPLNNIGDVIYVMCGLLAVTES